MTYSIFHSMDLSSIMNFKHSAVSWTLFAEFCLCSSQLLFESPMAFPTRHDQMKCVLCDLVESQIHQANGWLLPGFQTMMTALLFVLPMWLFQGLLPFTFPEMTHPTIVFPMSLSLWMPIFVSSASAYPSLFAAKMIPLGTPDWLASFMALSELMSHIIRPVTLTLRLTINLTVGHIILTLLGSLTTHVGLGGSLVLSSGLLILSLFYWLLEMVIITLQVYIFFTLLNLYTNDHEYKPYSGPYPYMSRKRSKAYGIF